MQQKLGKIMVVLSDSPNSKRDKSSSKKSMLSAGLNEYTDQ